MEQLILSRLDTTAGIIAGVIPEQLSIQTPCADYDVRGVINHLVGGTRAIALAARGEQVDLAAFVHAAEDHVAAAGDDLKAVAEDLLTQARAALEAGGLAERTLPIGEGMPGKLLLRIALVEAVIHGWDVAKATGQAYEIPDELAAPMLDGMRKAFGDGERPPGGGFGPIVPVPDDAPLADQLIGFTGRRP